ncbi:hypothetical protein ACFL6U_20750 [Planctomycetota bacterium]
MLQCRVNTVWVVLLLSGLISGSVRALDLGGAEAAAVKASQPSEPFKALGAREELVIPNVPRNQVICFALYTTQNNVLKLSAQLYPLNDGEARDVTLYIDRGNGLTAVATQKVDEDHWMTTFRVEPWDDAQFAAYRLTHPGGAAYDGIVRANPQDKNEIVVAAFTGNSNRDRSPRADIIRNVNAQNPDLLFFSGDQSYDHKHHLAAWLLFGRQFGAIIRNRPTVTIPDDHDVGQGNLWGAAGKKSKGGGGDDGGYIMPVQYVNMVQRAQTAHLPDPVDPTPVKRGVTVYYTRLNIGGIDFAIVEDRKWKTGPAGLVPRQGPRADHINDPNYDPQSVDLPEAVLLGERQLSFLQQWGEDWTDAQMKCVLSQTIFAGGAHIHGKINGRLIADMDSNGWPQQGRNRALLTLRKSFAFHIAGDQHLATVIHHGVNQWEDAGWSFCVPSIVNYYGRWWWPLEEPLNHDPASPLPFTGRFYDGFRNKVTMHAYANPTRANENAAGYGVVRFNKKTRKITMECWPRRVDVTSADAPQYTGWPKTIDQYDNYSRHPSGYLPTVSVQGAEDPVVQVIDEGLGSVVYTLRIKGTHFQPIVFRTETPYTVRVDNGVSVIEKTSVLATGKPNRMLLPVVFKE